MTSSGSLTAAEKASLPILPSGTEAAVADSDGLLRTGLAIPKYRPEGLDKVETGGPTSRTSHFLHLVRELSARTGGEVPFAFRLEDGTTRWLDAGCLGFLVNKERPDVRLLCDADGFVTAIALDEPSAPAQELADDRPTAPLQGRIFATLVFGLEPEVWGAFGWANEKVRDRLAQIVTTADRVLAIGTQGPETPQRLRGRLLALVRVAPQSIQTEALVEPEYWRRHLEENGGVARWPYGMPITFADMFRDPLPISRNVLPRFYEENLHMKLATNFVELTSDERERVFAYPRTSAPTIWSSPRGSFAGHLLKGRPGPPPSPIPRVLSPKSGNAATYCFSLEGPLAERASGDLLKGRRGWGVLKVGFSNDPLRRRRELNAYIPNEQELRWAAGLEQWHDDEINAYAMEQEVFSQLSDRGARRFKGELVLASAEMIQQAWVEARVHARRPDHAVTLAPDGS